MWIDRLEFIGFGNLTGQRIDFAKNKLSVVTQANEYGKSTMCEAIWAILYDYTRNSSTLGGQLEESARRPLSGAAYKACMDLTVDERQMRLIRDFAARSLKVLDLSKDQSKADSDITQEFAELIADGRFGEQLTSLNRHLFRSVCVIDQDRASKPPFAGDRALSGMLLDTAGPSSTAGNVFDAIAALEEKLRNFSFRGKQHPIDELITGMEAERKHLADDLRRLESERLNCDRDVEELSAVEDRLHLRQKVVSTDEYFQTCLELAEVEDRLSRAQERIEHIRGLESGLAALCEYARFGTESGAAIGDMWLRRQARLADLTRLQSEVREKMLQSQIKDEQDRMLGQNLENFTQDDAHMLSALARGLEEVLHEIEDTSRKHDEESRRVKSQGVDLEVLSGIRKSLLRLEPKELDELHSIHSIVVATRERTNELLSSAENAATTIAEITKARQMLVKITFLVFWPLLAVAGVFLILMLLLLDSMHISGADPRVALAMLLWASACAGCLAAWYVGHRVNRAFRVKEEGAARLSEQQCQMAVQELTNKLTGCESRIKELSEKANLESADQLVRNMQEYSLSASQLKELDFLEYLLRNQNSRADKLRQEIKPYFLQAKRENEPITPQNAELLAQDIGRFIDAKHAGLQTNTGEHRASEIKFIGDELKDEDRLIITELAKLHITGATIEEAYANFLIGLNNFRKWETLHNELERLTDESAGELTPEELPKLVERLEMKRAIIWARMQELMTVNPDIANMKPPSGNAAKSEFGEEIADLRLSVEKLKLERDELTVKIRAAMKNYQDNYLKSLEKLEAVERDLEHLKHARASLRLARDTFLRLAEEHHAVWADRLNEIAVDLLKQAALEYEMLEFDADMNLTARRKGQREPFSSWQMSHQVSQGSREQLNFVAHLAVSQFLSKRQPLPLILDEPFADIDDDRFVRNMRLLIKMAGSDKQIIVFSCHQKRHQWLKEQLSHDEQQSLELCQLVPLKADAGSFVRR